MRVLLRALALVCAAASVSAFALTPKVTPNLNVPELDLSERRLLLLRHGAAEAEVAAVSAHIAEDYGIDVRYIMACSTEPAAVRDAEAVAASLAPLVVGGVAVETADLLRGRDEAEDEELYIERVLSMRDFVLRGTKAGYASVVLLGEGSLRAIIGDALALGAESAEGIERDDALPAASLSVLDFGDGSWPAIVAEAPPAVRCLGYVPS